MIDSRRLALVLAVALGGASPAWSQFQHVLEVEVRPGGESRYESLFAALDRAAEASNSPMEWMVFDVVTGKRAPTYRVVFPFAKWAERDGWTGARRMLADALGEAESERVWSQAHEAVVSIDSQVWQALPDSDSNPRDGVANFYEVYVREVEAGTEREIRDLHRKFKEAYDAAPSRPSVTRSVLVFGKNQGLVFRRVSAFDRWAEMDDTEARGILSTHFGPESSRAMVDTVRRAAVWTDHFVSALRRDLSRGLED